MKIKTNDQVLVLAGKDKGKTGRVLRVLRKEERVVVEGVNIVKKHQKPNNANENGGIFEMEAPIHVSNVAFYDSKTKAPVKLGYKFIEEDGKKVKVRVNRKTGAEVDKKKKKK